MISDGAGQSFAAPDVVFVDANGPDAAIDDLRLMAACRHHVIANSSLSWWGAWLAQHSNQVVIAPQPWFPGVTDAQRPASAALDQAAEGVSLAAYAIR